MGYGYFVKIRFSGTVLFEVADQLINFFKSQVLMELRPALKHRSGSARAEAFDRFEGKHAIGRCFPFFDSEGFLDMMYDILRTPEASTNWYGKLPTGICQLASDYTLSRRMQPHTPQSIVWTVLRPPDPLQERLASHRIRPAPDEELVRGQIYVFLPDTLT